MKVFVDANILLSALNKEYPTFTQTSQIISLHESNRLQIFTSPICRAIAFYFAKKKSKATLAKKKIALLSQNIFIAAATPSSVASALANPRVNDFEDGLEY